ncbi:tetratricopeptide repeat protein [Myxococcus sp. 1LA]
MSGKNPLRTASELALAGRVGEAIDFLEAILARTRSSEERPANTSLLARTAGVHCVGVGDLEQAALYFEEAVATAGHDATPLLALAGLRWQQGQADSARSCLERAESIAQSSADAEALQMVADIRAGWASDDG